MGFRYYLRLLGRKAIQYVDLILINRAASRLNREAEDSLGYQAPYN